MEQNILVIAAHPDDEVLGCGGTIAKHAASGNNVYILILAEGITSRDANRQDQLRTDELNRLRQEAALVAAHLGAKGVYFGGFPDNRMDSVDLLDIIKVIEQYADKIQPDIVYTHNRSDVNIDHQVTHDAALAAFRSLPGSKVQQLLFFEVLSSTEWQCTPAPVFWPNYYVDVSDFLQVKCEAMKIYTSELREWPHPRSCRALEMQAALRGSAIGVDAAEGFVIGRMIWR